MKARKVKGLDPEGTLADNVEKIIRVRLDELHSFMPAALDPANVEDLHDMRIAAKRLRYILEHTEHCFGPYAATGTKRARDIQDLVGEIHDCDVALPRVLALAAELRTHAAADVRVRAGDAKDLEPRLVADAPNADSHRGLQSMAVYLEARRSLLFERFVELWTQLARDGFRARLEFAISERAPLTAASREGNGAVPADALPSSMQQTP